MQRLLRGETVREVGPYAWGDECALRFAPLRPDPPLNVAGFGEELLRLAGEVGDGAMPMATPPESVAPLVAEIHAGAEGAGRDPSELEVIACAWLSLSEVNGLPSQSANRCSSSIPASCAIRSHSAGQM